MFEIRTETPVHVPAREALLDACFGPARREKTCERLREGRLAADGLSLVVEQERRLVATIRLWNVAAGPGRPALLLGPVAVNPALQGAGVGSRLIRTALERATGRGHGAVLLVGDAPYYGRFGFSAEPVSGLWLPGPHEAGRFLGLELVPGALEGARGLVQATGARQPSPDLRTLVAAERARHRDLLAA